MGCQETQGTRTDMSLLATQWCRKESEGLETNNSWTRAGTSGNPERRTMKGSGWETFNLARRNQLTWEKWQRERQPNAESENVRFKSLEGKRTKGQLLKDTLERKVNKRLLGKKHQKKKIMRNEEETSHQYCWHNIGSGTQGSKWGELVVSREP